MQSQWNACPTDILQRCLAAQVDYADNAAAACVCRLWKDTCFAGQDLDLAYGALRSHPRLSYLRQFNGLTSLTLHGSPLWDTDRSRQWLLGADGHDPQQHSIPFSTWTKNLSAIPVGCIKLSLQCYLPKHSPKKRQHNSKLSKAFGQLNSLQHLIVEDMFAQELDMQALAGLTSLQILEISTGLAYIRPIGSLQALPSSITKLSLTKCTEGYTEFLMRTQDLLHMHCLQDLEFTRSFVDLSCVARLRQLTRLSLNNTEGICNMQNYIFRCTALRVLCFRECDNLYDSEVDIPLGDLLQHLRCLQELDILHSSRFTISPAHCTVLRLQSFSFSYSQLTTPGKSHFEHFVVAPDAVSKPFLRVDGNAGFPLLSWFYNMPLPVVVHLTMLETVVWPAAFFCHPEAHLQQLHVLDVRFSSRPTDGTVDSSSITLGPKLKLTELYLADSSNRSFFLAECTSLVAVGISYRGVQKPDLLLPPFLTKLCLHNTLSASTDHQLEGLHDLVTIKLGGRAARTEATRQLPKLPQSVVELDLWDGLLTDLQELTRLTNLKKLIIPDPPTQQQLHIIRQLRQLRHLEVTGQEGMHTSTGRLVVPWADQ